MSRALSYVSISLGDLLLKHQDTTINHVRAFAARKGYREIAKRKKVKTVIEKQAWVPHNLRIKDNTKADVAIRSKEELRPVAFDDVWVSNSYAWRVFEFREAVECHRETHDPTVYNVPNAPVHAFIELDMSTSKPTRFVEKFRRMAILPHVFEQEVVQERNVLVFCKTPEEKKEAEEAGADIVGGVEIIKDIEKGRIVLPDFRFVLAHPTILPELVMIRGLLKKKFPSAQAGTLGPNLGEMVIQYKNGVEYSGLRNLEEHKDFGWVDAPFGRLTMDTKKLEENLQALLNDVNKMRPKRPGPFITKVLLTSKPSVEKLKINLSQFLQEEKVSDEGDSSDEDEDVKVKV